MEEIFSQDIFLSSILAGFAFAISVQLLSLKDKRPVTSATMCVLLISAMLFLVITFLEVFFVLRFIDTQKPFPQEVLRRGETLVKVTALLNQIGAILLFTGIGMVGWVQSKVTGIITTASAIISYLLFAIVWNHTIK
jgi:hypothetical protein